MPWEHFAHEADIGIRGRGPSMESAFVQAALALTAVITDPAGVAPREPVAITCEVDDPELLFVDWLNAIVFEMTARDLLFGRYEVALEPGRLRATAWGEPVDVAKHAPAVEVKGATYTGLRVAREADGSWVAECVVDV
jgi:tRNA nucleotidyltransferase (CCA-adding enzyme)